MRLALLLLALALPLAAAEDIETLKHEVLKEAKIVRVELDGVVIAHSAGISKIPFAELPEEYKKRFGYDPAKAAEFAAKDAELQRQLYISQQAERQAANARDAKVFSANAAEVEAANKRRAIAKFVLEAHEVGTGSVSWDTWHTDYGSYDRQTAEDKKIVVSVHDVGGSSATCKVHVYFVGESAEGNLFVYAKRSVDLLIAGGQEAKSTIAAPTLASEVLNLQALGVSYASGAWMKGWIAIASIEEQEFGSVCSQGVVCSEAGALIAAFEAQQRSAVR